MGLSAGPGSRRPSGRSGYSRSLIAATDPNATRARRTDLLPDLLRERILVLDGAMGTMIQTHELDEAAFVLADAGGPDTIR